ncbi:MAG: chemotaxis protein CheA, partial [Pseudomonadota bacterium]
MDPMDELRDTFFEECAELLEELEAGLLLMNDGGADGETVNAVFRAVHSIKGGAGAFALSDLVAFAHKFETTLDEVRADRLEATGPVMAVLLRAGDMLADLVRAARDGSVADLDASEALIAELAAIAGLEDPPEDGPTAAEQIGFAPAMIDLDMFAGDDAEEESEETEPAPAQATPEDGCPERFQIRFVPAPALYTNGNEPAMLFRALATLGPLAVSCDTRRLPQIENIAAEGAYLVWTLTLETEAGAEAVAEVFEFVEDDCELEITPLEPRTGPSADAGWSDVAPAPMEPATPEVAAPGAARPAPLPIPGPASPVASAEAPPGPAPAAEAPAPPRIEPTAKPAAREAAAQKPTVRVDLERVDRLINLVGEMVINQAMLAQAVEDAGLTSSSTVSTGFDEIRQLTRDVQESVMAIRAQPVKSLFQRMSRIVREAATATGKTVRLVTEGETTEVDKTVIERLADPLTHMIRNAVDHGLETPDRRRAAGKGAEGTVHLSAAHRSGRVIIEVTDDGAGINRDRVLGIAVEKGLVSADAQLSENEIDNLLFMPGFSTAKEVSDLSGRGVGMDVVK